MKIKRVPIATISLLVVVLIRFIVKRFFPATYFYASVYLDFALVAVVIIYLVYYAKIYITAWLRNRKEEAANS